MEAVPVELDEGESLPDWREFDAVLVMGGPMGAYEEAEHPWLAAEKELVREAAEDGRPILGVCLGVQVLASALGAEVGPMERAEVGLLPVELTDRGPRAPALRRHARAAGLAAVARRHLRAPRRARRCSRARPPPRTRPSRPARPRYGVQFHLEVTPEMAREWAQVPAYSDSLAATLGEERGAEFLAEVERRAAELHPAARRLFENWLDLAASLRPGGPATGVCTKLFSHI